MKNLFLAILTIWSVSTTYASSVITDSTFIHHMILNGLQNADYIFEGEVVEVTSYFNEKEDYIYTSNTIHVNQLWKTNEAASFGEGEYVEIITRGGTVDNLTLSISHNIGFTVGQKGMFICKPTVYYPNPKTTLPQASQLQLYDGLYFDYDFSKGYVSTHYSTVSFECIDLLYEAIDSSYVAECLQVYPNGILQNLSYTQFISISNTKLANASSGNETITYTFENAKTTSSGGKSFFEYDIYISSSNSVYFDNALVRIEYNTQAFGTNIVSNNKVTAQRGIITASIGDYFVPSPSDISTNVFAIGVSADISAQGKYFLTSTPEQLMHVKMEIKDCSKLPDLKFVDPDTMLMLSFYTTTPSGTSLLGFDNINTSDIENSKLCQVSVASLSPNKVNGGTGDIVTIKGNQFGNTIGTIQMQNADDSGNWISLDNYDITQWTDTEIKIRIPSTIPINVTNPNQFKTPGSGNIKIITSTGTSFVTTQSLEVYYSWKNDIRSSIPEKNKIFLAGRDSVFDENGINQQLGYSFILNPNITSNSSAKGCILKAINDWVCATEIRWQIDDSVAALPDARDYYSTIRFGQTSQSNVLAETSTWHLACAGVSSQNIAFNPDIDIILSNATNHTWFYDSTGLQNQPASQYDFYSVILHELGHAHLLKHVREPNDLMFWEAKHNPTSNISWIERATFFSLSNLDGGIAILTQSANVNFSNCNTNSFPIAPLEKSNCSISLNTDKLYSEKFESKITAFPNPFSEYAEITFKLNKSSEASLSVYNSWGKLVLEIPNGFYPIGSHNLLIQSSNLPKGFYIAIVKIGKNTYPIKLIKQ